MRQCWKLTWKQRPRWCKRPHAWRTRQGTRTFLMMTPSHPPHHLHGNQVIIFSKYYVLSFCKQVSFNVIVLKYLAHLWRLEPSARHIFYKRSVHYSQPVECQIGHLDFVQREELMVVTLSSPPPPSSSCSSSSSGWSSWSSSGMLLGIGVLSSSLVAALSLAVEALVPTILSTKVASNANATKELPPTTSCQPHTPEPPYEQVPPILTTACLFVCITRKPLLISQFRI